MGDDDFPSSEYFHGRSNDIGEDDNHFSSDFDIPLMNKIINEDDGPRNEDHVLNHSVATNEGDRHCKETLCLGPILVLFISIQIILVIQGLGNNFSLNQFS